MISTIEVEKRTSEFLEILRHQLSKNTPEQISEASGLPLETVQRIIDGSLKDPPLSVIVAISAAFRKQVVTWDDGNRLHGMNMGWGYLPKKS